MNPLLLSRFKLTIATRTPCFATRTPHFTIISIILSPLDLCSRVQTAYSRKILKLGLNPLAPRCLAALYLVPSSFHGLVPSFTCRLVSLYPRLLVPMFSHHLVSSPSCSYVFSPPRFLTRSFPRLLAASFLTQVSSHRTEHLLSRRIKPLPFLLNF